MGRSPTLLMCPGCKSCQPCSSTALGHIFEDGLELRQRQRTCTDCGHEFLTAELPYLQLEKLLRDRQRLKGKRSRCLPIEGFENVIPFPVRG